MKDPDLFKIMFEVQQLIEVEVKAHVNDFDEIKVKLDAIGAKKEKKEHQEDIYFNNIQLRDFEKTDEALRIRKTTIDGNETIILTYKGAKLDSVSKTRKEIEVEVEESKKTELILQNLGFEPVETIKKDRTTYLYNEFIITLDKVYKVGNFVEIEKEANEGENFDDTLDEIFKIYKKLSIEDGFERKSYLELLGIYKGI